MSGQFRAKKRIDCNGTVAFHKIANQNRTCLDRSKNVPSLLRSSLCFIYFAYFYLSLFTTIFVYVQTNFFYQLLFHFLFDVRLFVLSFLTLLCPTIISFMLFFFINGEMFCLRGVKIDKPYLPQLAPVLRSICTSA